MRPTKQVFNSVEMALLNTIVSELEKELAVRGTLDENAKDKLARVVIRVASHGISNPDEIRLLVLDHFKR